MRKRTFITLSLLLSLVFNQVLAASVVAQFHHSTESTHNQEEQGHTDTAHNQHMMDCLDFLGNKSIEKDLLHASCHCPAMSISCSSGVVFNNTAGLKLPDGSLSYSLPIDLDTLASRALCVELRPPKSIS